MLSSTFRYKDSRNQIANLFQGDKLVTRWFYQLDSGFRQVYLNRCLPWKKNVEKSTACSLAVLIWLVNQVELSGVMNILKNTRGVYLSTAIVSAVGVHVLNCVRWRYCLLEESERFSISYLLFSYWTSLPIGMILPTEYGGDTLRIKDVYDPIKNKKVAVSSVFWSRFSGVWSTFLLFCMVGLFGLQRLIALDLVVVWIFAVVACGVSVLIVKFDMVYSTRLKVQKYAEARGWVRSIYTMLQRIESLISHPNYATRIMLLAILSQCFMVLTNYLFAKAIALPVSVLDMALFIPLVSVVSIIPIGIGGIGVREGIFVLFWRHAGLSADAALSLALINRMIQLLFTLSGALVFPFRRSIMARLMICS